jgi:hypothetical protein
MSVSFPTFSDFSNYLSPRPVTPPPSWEESNDLLRNITLPDAPKPTRKNTEYFPSTTNHTVSDIKVFSDSLTKARQQPDHKDTFYTIRPFTKPLQAEEFFEAITGKKPIRKDGEILPEEFDATNKSETYHARGKVQIIPHSQDGTPRTVVTGRIIEEIKPTP